MPTVTGLSPEEVVLFVDMLGFGDLCERRTHRLITEVSDDENETSTSSSASANQFAIFHGLLDRFITKRIRDGDFKAMVFSDCAFFVLGPP